MSSDRSQNHCTLAFPIKSSADAQALAQELPPLMPDLFRAEDAIGTVHYSRFTVLSDKTLLFLADFDGEFGPLMLDLAGRAGPVFDAIFKHMSDPPPLPVASNAEAFADWAAGQGCSTLSVVVHIAQGFDAPEGGGVAILSDGVGLIEPQDIISEAAQSGEDAWVAADARGIFTEGDVAGVVLFVFDTPMFANGIGGLAGTDGAIGQVERGFA